MQLNINNINYIITDMIVTDNKCVNYMIYNVFKDNYKFVTSISCKNRNEFIKLFNDYLKQNN